MLDWLGFLYVQVNLDATLQDSPGLSSCQFTGVLFLPAKMISLLFPFPLPFYFSSHG
jgi:hypothetical protein